MSFSPQFFGEYVLFHRLAHGGMAEVYLARPRNTSLAKDRLLVIKKILPESSTDPDFMAMFKQEVSISLGLTNSNIIKTYDYGLADGEYYLALEYVPGITLFNLLKETSARGQKIPLEHACFIISEVCNALAYTHSFRDPFTGKHCSIIHRDISPQNILVGQIGAVKLFDFGIAKIEDSKGITKTGLIRGKINYLSPEQAANKDLDGRSDLFTVGSVLWEALTGARLFQFESKAGSIEKLMKQEILPPSSANRLVPKELDRITLKALTRDRYQRYQLAQDFQRDLHFFLQQRFPGYGPQNLAQYIQSVFEKDFLSEEAQIRALMGVDPSHPTREGTASIRLEQIEPRDNSIATPLSLRSLPKSIVSPALATIEFMRPAARSFKNIARQHRSRQVIPLPGNSASHLRRLAQLSALLFTMYFLLLGEAKNRQHLQIEQSPSPRRRPAAVSQPAPEAKSSLQAVMAARPENSGLLSIHTTPSAQLAIYSGDRLILEDESPLERISLPTGSYRVIIENSLLGHKSTTNFLIKKNRTTTLNQSLN
jgi:serine/threonine protein kinase